MKNLKIAFLLLVIGILTVHQVWARGAGTPVATPTPSITTNSAAPAPAAPTADTRDLVQNTSSAQKDNSKTGMIIGGGLAVAAGVCYAQPHPNKPLCAALAGAGAAAIVISLINKNKSDGNQNAANALTAGATPVPTTIDGTPSSTPTTTNHDNPNPADLVAHDPGAAAKLKAAGITINKNGTFTTPDGKKYPLDSTASPQAMASAGLNPGDFAKLQAAVKKIEADNKLKGTDGGDDDSTPMSGSGHNSGLGGAGVVVAGVAQPKLGINRDPAQVAGLQKTLNGEPIGVAADSIFGIIDRRYELHQQQGSFLSP